MTGPPTSTSTSAGGGAASLPTEEQQGSMVEAEADDYNDRDSTFGDHDSGSTTTSITSSIMKHREENGRRYHAYKEGKYVLPNDEEENDRLDLQHHLFYLTFNNKLHLCPIPKEKQLHRVLDVGTGTGIWAIDFADEHPEANVLGVDLSPIQPSFVPPNLSFEIDDLEETWTFSHKFDFIHSRMMTASISDWPRFFEQAYKHLNPGGYIEVVDIIFPMRADDNSFPPDSFVKKWSACILEACAKLNRPADSALKYVDHMRAAGFEDIHEALFKWPQNHWPKDPKMKELGVWTHADVCDSLSGLSMAMFTRALGWTPEELEVFLVDVRKEMKDTKVHAYFPISVVYAQKPS